MTWQTAKLGEVCEVVSGATPKTGKPEFWDGDVPWVTPKDLSDLDSKILSDTPRKITSAGFHSCSVRMLPVQSVLFSSRAPIGLVAINSIPVCTNQGFKSMVPRNGKVTSDYLYWWLRLNRGRLDKLGRGATFKEVSKKIMEEVEIPLPPLAEQNRIAGILDSADALRTKRREALAQLDTLLQSTFLDMFGDPVTNPMVWETETLINLCDDARGISYGVVQRGDHDPNGVPIVRIRDLLMGAIECDLLILCDRNITSKYKRTVLEGGELVISIRGTVGRTAVVPKILKGGNITRELALIPLRAAVVRSFVLELIRTESVFLRLAEDVKGVAQRGINLRDLRELSVIQPPLDLQHRFAAIVASVERQKARMRAHLADLDALFASLQSRAFSGTL